MSRGAEFILGTSGAVTRLSTFGLRPLATLVSKGGPDPNRNEGSAVIVREDHREFQTLGDLKGRTIAARNALSSVKSQSSASIPTSFLGKQFSRATLGRFRIL